MTCHELQHCLHTLGEWPIRRRMTPLEFVLLVFVAAIAAGVLGSLLGLGGGIIVIPFLTLVMGINIRYAIGASVISVIATSSGAAAAYVRERMTNLRVAMLLEIATASGALTGAFIAGAVPGRWLYVIFGLILAYSAIAMFRKRHLLHTHAIPSDALADR